MFGGKLIKQPSCQPHSFTGLAVPFMDALYNAINLRLSNLLAFVYPSHDIHACMYSEYVAVIKSAINKRYES
jgi:hypothetical protein